MEEITLEEIARVKKLSKAEFYQLMTGKAPSYSGTTEVDPWKHIVTEETIDDVMTAFERLEKAYEDGHFALSAARIREAYEEGDLEEFQLAIGGVLFSINCD